MTHVNQQITVEDLRDQSIVKGEFILFKTKNSNDTTFNPGFVFLEKSGAKYLVEIGIKGVGTDALGIERSQSGHETHIQLMNAGIVILEGLRLQEVEAGEYFLYAAPLFIRGAEAAPTRAILVK